MRIINAQDLFAAYEKILPQWEVLAKNKFTLPFDMAIVYINGNQLDKVTDMFEKGYEIYDPSMPYIAAKCFLLDSMYDNSRFIAILEKMNLPLP